MARKTKSSELAKRAEEFAASGMSYQRNGDCHSAVDALMDAAETLGEARARSGSTPPVVKAGIAVLKLRNAIKGGCSY